MAKVNEPIGIEVIHSGRNVWAAIPAGEHLNDPVHAALNGERFWGGRLDTFEYKIRPSLNAVYDATRWGGSSIPVDQIGETWHTGRLYSVDRDLICDRGVGLDQAEVEAIMRNTHAGVMRGALNALEEGYIESAGGREDVWFGAEPVLEAAEPWTSSADPVQTVSKAIHMAEVHDAQPGLICILSTAAVDALLANPKIRESSLWEQSAQADVKCNIPQGMFPRATARAQADGLWMRLHPTGPHEVAPTGKTAISPFWELVGKVRGVYILRDKLGLLKYDGLLLPRVSAANTGAQIVYGPVDVGGQMIKGAQIAIAKTSSRSGAKLSSYCSWGIMNDSGNGWGSCSLRNLVG